MSNAGVVRERGVAPDPEVVLDPTLGRQPVVVPADRVEDLLAPHALISSDQVGVRVRTHVNRRADVPLTVGGGVSIAKISSRVFDRSKRKMPAVSHHSPTSLPDRRATASPGPPCARV